MQVSLGWTYFRVIYLDTIRRERKSEMVSMVKRFSMEKAVTYDLIEWEEVIS